MGTSMDFVALRRLTAALLLGAAGGAALGHDVVQALPAPLRWSFDPWVLACLGASAWLYALDLKRLLQRSSQGNRQLQRRALYFFIGWVALTAALVSPLDAMGALLFSAHMLQHELMMIVSAPLLVSGRPFAPWTWALRPRWRAAVAAAIHRVPVQAVWHALTWPLFAWLLHALVLWLWHAPILFEAALHNNASHTAQHVSFVGSALLFWWAVLGDGSFRRQRGAAMLYIFTTMAHTGALSALLTWSALVWYPSYVGVGEAFGMGALEDQQLGGLIMWVPEGLAYLIAGPALAALRRSGRTLRNSPPEKARKRPRRMIQMGPASDPALATPVDFMTLFGTAQQVLKNRMQAASAQKLGSLHHWPHRCTSIHNIPC